MAIARVSGNILQDNLQRGANLSIQGNLIYFDVTNDKVGILTSGPTEVFTVMGNLSAGNIKIDTDTISGTANITLAPTGNVILSNTYINDLSDPVQAQDAATKNYVDSALSSVFTIEDDTANTTTVGDGDTLYLLGTANEVTVAITNPDEVTFGLPDDVVIGNTLSVTGNFDAANIYTGGNITALGNIQGGNVISDGAVIGNVQISGNLTVANLTVTEYFTGNYVSASNTISATGNVTGGNIVSNNTISGTTIIVSGNITGNNVTINSAAPNRILFTDASNTAVTSSNLTFDGTTLTMLGNTIIDNININDTVITSNANLTVNTTTGNLVFNLLGNGITQFNSTGSLTLPTGNTAQRPTGPDQGTIRFNNNTLVVEVWNGTTWDPVGQDFVQITNQIINGDGSTTIFTLNQSTTAAAIIVSTNGVMQFPDIAYSVTGNQITFAEAPQISDQIDVRFTASVAAISAITNTSGNAEIQVTAQGVANIASCDSLQLPSYTVAQTASIANPNAGQLIYVSNGDNGNPCLAVYSAGAWKRIALGANIST